MITEPPNLQSWAREIIEQHITAAAEALACHCEKPRSAKRVHNARKALARLRAALQDLGGLAGVTPDFEDRAHQLHRRAGKVRDADVLIARIDDYAEKASDDECDQLERLRAAFCKRRKRAGRKLDRMLRDLPELRA